MQVAAARSAWSGGVTMRVNDERVQPNIQEKYIHLDCREESVIMLDFHIRPRFVYANEGVWYDGGRKAVEYGPLVLCGESCDNGKNLCSVSIPSLARAKDKRR